ncbi:hypothetical protein H310_03823 [Aphanomyces invadans]|uniref:CSD domain-containing protein n=1 Tax=Aphanomyces invadans TaxID=157072 RepID=A0A024UFF9_9STRA|nr:hypothetical protein H310_03823 [Aphanomyces invadans]ETW04632.1 hypothetical protein H310_03823 [Aphanomyces invadans]|eukprot:XP_008866070.1 hypothetical protein H310_03823 [Aphanomyces invadans]
MFRQPQSGNWADACDEDDERVPLHQPPSAPQSIDEHYSSKVDQQPASRSATTTKAPAASNYWQTRAQQQQAVQPAPSSHANNSSFRRGDDGGQSYDRRDFRREYNDRGRDDRGGFNDRRRDFDDRSGGNRGYDDSSRFGRQGSGSASGRAYDRYDSTSSYGSRGGGYGRDAFESHRPAPSGRWGQPANVPRHEGFVTHVREDGGFGFLHCLELKQDVFFHESEVPARASTDEEGSSDAAHVAHVQVGDELSFEVTVNPRNGKESATRIQRLPKGTIVLEDVADEVTHGVVTKSLPPKHKQSHHFQHSSTRQAADATGTIDVLVPLASTTDDAAVAAPTPLRKPIVRFNAESFPALSHPPRVGDDVQFRIAIHRQTGLKRAVDLTVTLSAAAKRDAAIEAALTSLERETGVVTSIKGHTGTIMCLRRPQDATFAISKEDKGVIAEGDSVSFFIVPDDLLGSDADRDSSLGNAGNGLKSSGRRLLTAIRLEKTDVPVVFEAIVATNVEGTMVVPPKDLSRTHGYHHDSKQRGNSSSVGQIQPIVAEPATADSNAVPSIQVQWSEVSYPAKAGDIVTFDVMEDFRRGTKFAVQVKWRELHPDGREVGIVSSLKDDFGFIKCVDRHGDAYFRVADVVPAGASSHLALRQGVEVSFDVVPNHKQGGGKPDGIRAARVQVLPKHTIVWEVVVHPETKGIVTAVPVSSSSSYHRKTDGQHSATNHGSNADGRISFTTATCPLDPFPALRRELQTLFDVEQAPDVVELVLKQLTPSQRSAVTLYAKLVGLVTPDDAKSGRDIKVVLPAHSNRPNWTAAVEAHDAEAEFSSESVQDVRYEPHVGDEVTCSIVRTKRGQHLVAKTIVAIKTSLKAALSGEGWVTLVKSEGYGFIESTDGDSVFFHVTDIADKGSKLREGDEVQFAVKHGADRKKKAVNIVKVPPGTLPPKEVRTVEVVVVRASHRQKASGNSHKKQTPQSTAGKLKIRAMHADGTAVDEKDDLDDLDMARHGWMYHVEDQVDPAVVLRPGDVVTCQVVGKSKQATQVALVSSVAKKGVVELVNVNGGTIVVIADDADSGNAEERVTYLNKSLLWHGGHHGALGMGDKVEFAIAQPHGDKPAMATYIVRLEGVDRKGAGVNSSLRRVLKENGGSAATSHRMAKGPDGTKGFSAGWQADVGTA